MFLETDAVRGLSKFVAQYERYLAKTEAMHEEPISMLAYLIEMIQ